MTDKKLILILYLFFVIGKLFAQEYWSLEQCIQYALENNIEIKQQRINTDITQLEYHQSKYEAYPSLNAGIDYNFILGKSYIPENDQWENLNNRDASLGLSSSVYLFKGLTNYNKVNQSRFDLMNSQAGIEIIENEISILIATAYLDILYNKELLEIAKRQLELTKLQVERMEKRVEVGDGEKRELYSLIAQQALDTLKVTEVLKNIELSNLRLMQLLDMDTAENFSIRHPDLDNLVLGVPNTDSVYLIALEQFPTIKKASYQAKSAEYSLAIAKGERLPSLSLNFDYLYYNRTILNPMNQTLINPAMYYLINGGENHFLNARINLSVPIFNHNQITTKIGQAQLMCLSSELMLDKSKQKLYKDIKQLCLEITLASEKYTSAMEAVTATIEALDYAQEMFNNGMISIVEFNEEKNKHYKAQSDLLQAKYEYIIKLKILDFYSGNPITLE